MKSTDNVRLDIATNESAREEVLGSPRQFMIPTRTLLLLGSLLPFTAAWGCSASSDAASSSPPANADPGPGTDDPNADGADAGGDGSTTTPPPPCTKSPADCAAQWEGRASDRYQTVLGDPTALTAFLKAVPKGGDLHNHLTGAVYGETYLGWAKTDGDCINSTTFSSVYSNECTASTQAVPDPTAAFYDQILHAWSMKDFVAGSETGHDHFFATFGKYGAIAGAHRDDDIADVAKRAADENQLYVETMFNLGKDIGALAASVWTTAVTADVLETFYDQLIANAAFAAKVTSDTKTVTDAGANYKNILGCGGSSAPPACQVGVRFVSQVARTGALDTLFGQLVSAYEVAAKTPLLVAANLSSPEDDPTSLKNYDLHMAMLDFLNKKYTVTGTSPLHITLHAGELVPKFLPAAYPTANTFHVSHAITTGHAERIGHGLDILSETDPTSIMAEMKANNILVEICLSSNTQILEVNGAAHPLAQYIQAGVPVSLATDDQGVSRSSLAGEYARAATDQKLSYKQLKTMARNSLEHAFLPGKSLFTSVNDAQVVTECAATATMGVGDPANDSCKAALAASERATIQWELEHRFRLFESQL